MIDVKINPIGRQIMTMVLGAMKYQAVMKAQNIKMIQQQKEKVESLKKESEMWDDISFDMTTRLIDKRFKSSKKFMSSGGLDRGSLNFKKTTTDQDHRFQYIAEQNMLKASVRFKGSVSNYNKTLSDKKIKGSFKLADLKKIT